GLQLHGLLRLATQPVRPTQGLLQERIYLLFGDIQAPKLLIGGLELAHAGDLSSDQEVYSLQLREEVL
ncbi:MAG: hypothetical protein ACREXJ_10410, partial [Gammaproteobacteria bacterium]